MIQIVTQKYYENQMQNESAIHFLLFGAVWCGASQILLPVIDRLEEEYDGIITVGTVDVDKESTLVETFRITSTPTVIILNNLIEKKRAVGVKPIAFYRKMIKETREKT